MGASDRRQGSTIRSWCVKLISAAVLVAVTSSDLLAQQGFTIPAGLFDRPTPSSRVQPEITFSDITPPHRPTKRRHDTAFAAVLTAFAVASAADIGISSYQIQRGVAQEEGFGKWWQHSPGAFVASKGAMATIFGLGLHRLRQQRPKSALVIGLLATGIEAALAAKGARLGAPPR